MFAINPYIAGNPVGNSSAFVGRADILHQVRRVLRHPEENAMVLYGQRRIGKTSVLQALEAKLSKEGPYYPISVDLQDKASWEISLFLQELANKISETLGQAKPDLGPAPETTFRQVWLPDLLKTLPTETSLVLLFDEFDVLADPQSDKAGAAFFRYLRVLLATEPKRLNLVFVIGRNLDDLTHIAMLLFKDIRALRVSLLSHDETVELVRLSEANNGLNWSNEAK